MLAQKNNLKENLKERRELIQRKEENFKNEEEIERKSQNE